VFKNFGDISVHLCSANWLGLALGNKEAKIKNFNWEVPFFGQSFYWLVMEKLYGLLMLQSRLAWFCSNAAAPAILQQKRP